MIDIIAGAKSSAIIYSIAETDKNRKRIKDEREYAVCLCRYSLIFGDEGLDTHYPPFTFIKRLPNYFAIHVGKANALKSLR